MDSQLNEISKVDNMEAHQDSADTVKVSAKDSVATKQKSKHTKKIGIRIFEKEE